MSQEWKLVPVEPTEEMLRAAADVAEDWPQQHWEAMLAAAPVPPDVGEVEVLGWLSVDKLMPTQQDAKEYAGYKGQGDVKELVDRAHVTRLQAELASAKADKEAYAQNAIDLRRERDALKAEVERLKSTCKGFVDLHAEAQSELTKARELLRAIYESGAYKGEIVFRVRELLAQQSAPAAKDVES